MDLPSRAPNKINPRPDFRPEDFRKFMFHRGMDLTWEQSQECPCRRTSGDFVGSRFGGDLPGGQDSMTSEARPDCPVCSGRGYLYHSSQAIKGLITRASSTPEAYAAWGEYARGMCFFTLLPEHLPGLFDRITMENSVLVFRESKIRTSATIEDLRYPIETRGLDLSTGITQVGVLHVQASDADGLTTEAMALTQGVDYAVTNDGKIDWTLGDAGNTAPALDTRYAVAYYAKPRYVVVDSPHTHRDTFVKTKSVSITFVPMPVQAMGKLDFLGDPT